MSLADGRPLFEAQRIAEALCGELAPACIRLEIAGSIRRQRERVSDIELVAIPAYREEMPEGAQVSLFAPPPEPILVNCLWERITAMGRELVQPIKPGTTEWAPDLRWPEKRLAGSRFFRLWLPRTQIQVDLFMADPRTWGAIYTIRTGSADFARALVTRWTQLSLGGHCDAGLLTRRDGSVYETPEEEDFFGACQIRYVEPRRRFGPGDLLERL